MIDTALRTLALIRKELLALLKDPRTRFSLFLPPIIQCFLFGYAASYDLNHAPYAVLDQDHSAASHDLLARLDGSGVFQRVANLDRAADIKKPARRRPGHRRRPQLQHRRHRPRLRRRHGRRLQRRLAASPRPGRAPRPGHRALLV